MNISDLLTNTSTLSTIDNSFLHRVSTKSSTLSTIFSYTPNIILPDSLKQKVNLDSLDKFACDQLDKLEQTFPILGNSNPEYDKYIIEHQPRSSGWTSVVTNVPSNIGAMVISDDVLKGLKYCLNWIESAKLHIDHQILLLRQYIASYLSSKSASHTSTSQHVATTSTFIDLLNNIKRELVSTLRNVVDVIGRNAAIYLPNDARQSVRGFILSLPTKWQSNPIDPTDPTPQPVSQTPTPPLSPLALANKVISFGTESSDMLKGVHSVFGQTLEGAESLLGRKVVFNGTSVKEGDSAEVEEDAMSVETS